MRDKIWFDSVGYSVLWETMDEGHPFVFLSQGPGGYSGLLFIDKEEALEWLNEAAKEVVFQINKEAEENDARNSD